MRFLIKLVLLILLIAAVVVGLAYAGWYSVPATEPHWAVTRWFLDTARENAVEREAAAILVPADLNAEARQRGAVEHRCIPA